MSGKRNLRPLGKEIKHFLNGRRCRFSRLSYRTVYHAPYEIGWAHTQLAQESGGRKVFPDDPLGPDEVLPMPPPVWPETPVVPFHYPNPVSGKPWV